MNYHRDRLLRELRDPYKRRCPHGAVDYPYCWNTKTREKLLANGTLTECRECKPLPGSFWLLISADSEAKR